MANEYSFSRPQAALLLHRLRDEPRRFLQIVAGPRQVGKTTLAKQVVEQTGLPCRIASADAPDMRGPHWIAEQWQQARQLIGGDIREALLVLDEVQKVPDWSSAVKWLWDEDTAGDLALKVVLTDSSPLLAARGLRESLAGRFEVLRLPHWNLREMRAAFGWTLEQFLFHGSYPGAVPLINEPDRWTSYIREGLVETSISRDVLLMQRVDKPALLHRLFDLGCTHPCQILSYNKMLGQLQDPGNTVTLAHYLELLSGAGLLAGLQQYSSAAIRQRASSPKLQVFNTALLSALAKRGDLAGGRADRAWWGWLTEAAVGAHLINQAAAGECEVFYWRHSPHEVDFVVRREPALAAIEVKSGRPRPAASGMHRFRELFRPTHTLWVGADGIDLEEFLSEPITRWLR